MVQGSNSINESVPGVFGVVESLGVAEVEGKIINIGFFGEADALK